jgi:Fe-Mn family superoxide dismutase
MEKKLELLKETILLGESLITEAKKIGIDKLPYGYDSLTRFIDVKTMNVHYNNHYKGYVKKLNDALSKKNYGNVELEDIIKSITRYPKVIRNNGGGAYNHSLFWKMLSPEKQTIKGEILTKINKEFGSYKEFKKKFEEESIGRFGSGWAWLVLTKNNRLKIMTTPNQDNPQMNDIDGGYPLLGLDLWEHAYYLKYQSKRDEYIKRFWDVVNWEFVNDVYLSKLKTKLKESIKSNKVINEEGSYKNFKYNPIKDFGKVTEFIKENGRINPKVFDVMLPKVYPKCSPEIINDYNKDTHITEPCFGKIKTNDCETNYGVIGGKYAVSQRGGIGEWSVINWFDANTKVSDKILEYFEKYNKEGLDFISWFFKLKKTLLSDDGKFTGELADFIMNPQTKKGTLDYGSSRESLALEILNKEYGNSNITRFCDGDIRDKYKGQDMKLTNEDISEYIQVKPTRDLYETNIDGQVKYVFKSKNKYTPNNINIFAFIDNIKNYVFFDFKNVEVKEDGGQSKERYSYIFKSENIKFKSNTLRLNKLVTESKLKKIIITEEQKKLIEAIIFQKEKNLIEQLCSFKEVDNIYCHFQRVIDSIEGEEKEEIIKAADTIINFYYPQMATRLKDKGQVRYIVFGGGIVYKILELALKNDLPGNFIKTIAKFITNPTFDNTETENRLKRLKKQSDIKTENLDNFLSQVREKTYSNYETSLEGDYMGKYQTSLELKYNCDKFEKRNFVNVVEMVKSGQKGLDEVINDLVECITNNMKQTNPIKADLIAKSDFYYNDKVIFKRGDKFEVKMMSTNVDSYLSEFFSIFKRSKVIKKIKDTHLDVYNQIINYLHYELFDHPIVISFLEKIRNNIAGIFFENNVVVPIQYIKLYWSNKGQKTCTESRLSIRFKIIDSNVISYIYDKNTNELQLNTEPIKVDDFKEIDCW